MLMRLLLLFVLILAVSSYLIIQSIFPANEPQLNGIIEQPSDEHYIHSRFDSSQALVKRSDSATHSTLRSEDTASNVNHGKILTMEALMNYLKYARLSTFEMSRVIDLINASEQAYNYVLDSYFDTPNPEQRSILLSILYICERPEKTALALDFIDSINKEERKLAYAWLSQAEQMDSEQTTALFIDALLQEQNNGLLLQLLLATPFPEGEDNTHLKDSSVAHIQSLIFHESELVSSVAISTLAQLAPNEHTLTILSPFLAAESEIKVLAAIKGLHNYKNLEEDLMDTLRTLKRDPNISPKVVAAVANLLTSLGEYPIGITDPFEES